MNYRFVLALVAAGGFLPTASADDLADLFNRVPAAMNTVAVLNVREINKSPRAVKEKWQENHETEYLAGAAAVSPWTTVVVIGADLHPRALGQGRSVALIPVGYSVDSSTIAKRETGSVQSVGDLTLVLSPKRGYFGFPTAGIVAVSGTMPRQDFARWVRSARTADKPAVSAYLQGAVSANKAAHVLIATDLKDLFDPTAIRVGLQQAGITAADLDYLVGVISGARGLVFTAQIEEKTKATLRIEFTDSVADLLPTFRKLWPKVLEASGLEIEEFKTAVATADDKAVSLTADLSDTSLRRVLSLVATPGDAVPAEGAAIQTPKEAATLAASLRYYRAVNMALDDLKNSGGTGLKDYVRSAAYFDLYAAKVEKLGLTDVDPALVGYGASAAAKLRALAGSLRGAKVQLQTYNNYKSTTWEGNRWSSQLSTNVQEMDTKSAALVAQLEPERAKIWGVLEGDRSAVRREMLDKYKIDFDQYKR